MCRPAKRPKIESMLEILSSNFDKFKDPRKGPVDIKLQDFLKSAYSIFSLKYPSLLSFEKDYKNEELIHKNVKHLFKIDRLPSDTHLRDVLDNVNSDQYRKIFKEIFANIQSSKILERYTFLEVNHRPYYLIAVDGSGYFSSKKQKCSNCTVYNEDDPDKETRFGHQVLAASIVHPLKKEVFSLCPEPIMKQDGVKKNDCELNAFKRFVKDFRREHPKLNVIFLLDALYANTPVIKLLKENRIHFIINAKDTKSALLRQFKDERSQGFAGELVDTMTYGEKIKKTKTSRYEYSTDLKLGQREDSADVHYLRLQEDIRWLDKDGKNKKERKTFGWISDIYLKKENVKKVAQGGRTRWKIENETFNTLKNQDYNLEHNFGHGKNQLSMNFIRTMFLAFLVDQVQQSSCQKFRSSMILHHSKKSFWKKLSSCLEWLEIESWSELWEKIAPNPPPEYS